MNKCISQLIQYIESVKTEILFTGGMRVKSIQYALDQPLDRHDEGTIKRRLDEIPGVNSVALNLNSSLLCVDYDDTATDEQELEHRLAEMHYPVTFIDSISF